MNTFALCLFSCFLTKIVSLGCLLPNDQFALRYENPLNSDKWLPEDRHYVGLSVHMIKVCKNLSPKEEKYPENRCSESNEFENSILCPKVCLYEAEDESIEVLTQWSEPNIVDERDDMFMIAKCGEVLGAYACVGDRVMADDLCDLDRACTVPAHITTGYHDRDIIADTSESFKIAHGSILEYTCPDKSVATPHLSQLYKRSDIQNGTYTCAGGTILTLDILCTQVCEVKSENIIPISPPNLPPGTEIKIPKGVELVFLCWPNLEEEFRTVCVRNKFLRDVSCSFGCKVEIPNTVRNPNSDSGYSYSVKDGETLKYECLKNHVASNHIGQQVENYFNGDVDCHRGAFGTGPMCRLICIILYIEHSVSPPIFFLERGKTMKFECEDGYVASGSEGRGTTGSAECYLNGELSVRPSCLKVCKDEVRVKHGSLRGNCTAAKHGDECMVRCSLLYKISKRLANSSKASGPALCYHGQWIQPQGCQIDVVIVTVIVGVLVTTSGTIVVFVVVVWKKRVRAFCVWW